jgi:hypothetical protein
MTFDIVSWYGAIAGVAVIYLLWASVIDTGHRHYRWIQSRLRPEPLPAPELPVVVLGHPGATYSTKAVHERGEGEPPSLIRVEPYYTIENKGTTPVREIDAGIDSRDGTMSHQFTAFHAPAIGPGERPVPVTNVGSIPLEMLAGVPESEHVSAFLWWASFEDENDRRWKAVYDPKSRKHTYALLEQPAPLEAQLDARIRKAGDHSYVMDIENTGEVPVEQVEVDMPSEAFNWHLLTDGLANYPIPVLEPGDRQTAHVAVTMGPHASVEITLRGLVEGQPYERRRVVSVIGS